MKVGSCPICVVGSALTAAVAAACLLALPERPTLTHAAEVQDQPVSEKVQGAVDKALAFLRDSQQPNGDWPHGEQAGTTAVPSLAVLAFLARGHVPGQGQYVDTLDKAIDFVLDRQKENGLLARDDTNAEMYEHGISTVMLAEVYGMVDDARRARIDHALAKSVKLVLDAQQPAGHPKDGPHRGGWRYRPDASDADISCTGWQLMALRGAANCGAAIPKQVLDEGLAYVRRCSVSTGGFSYQADPNHNGAPNQARTGTGILSMVLIGGDRNAPEVQKAGDYLVENPPDGKHGNEFYFYAVYYDSQALNQLGGKYWETVYPKLVDALLALQQDNGVFRPAGGQEDGAGDAYRTSMAVLALCVPYRYLPLYQADK